MRLSHEKWCYRICPCVNVFSHFSFRCNCSCWPLLWSCSWRNPLRPRSWCNKCSVSPHRWDIRTGAYQSTRFSGKMTLHMNEWCIYIELYCVLFYTQSASQSCGGSLLNHHQCAKMMIIKASGVKLREWLVSCSCASIRLHDLLRFNILYTCICTSLCHNAM